MLFKRIHKHRHTLTNMYTQTHIFNFSVYAAVLSPLLIGSFANGYCSRYPTEIAIVSQMVSIHLWLGYIFHICGRVNNNRLIAQKSFLSPLFQSLFDKGKGERGMALWGFTLERQTTSWLMV